MRRLSFITVILTVLFAAANTGRAYSQLTWLEQANQRIDSIRKGNFAVKILDFDSNPFIDTINIRFKKHEFPFGTTVPIPGMTNNYPWAVATALKYYNNGTFGEFKWPYMEPVQGDYFYEDADSVYRWAEKVGWDIRAHTLIWGGPNSWQMPSWTLEESLPPEDLYNYCEERIKRDVARFNGTVKEYDVINEPVHELWLSDRVGDSVNWNAFKWAREEDPDAILYVNEYNVLVWGSLGGYVQEIQRMLDHGAPIDGIGVQGHLEDQVNWEEVKERLDSLAWFGLPVKITEFDLKVDQNSLTELQQATEYAKMYRVAFSHPAVAGITQWDFSDVWAYNAGAGIISENNMPKIAADSLYHLIHEEWTTDIRDKTDGEGILPFRGFYGDYEVIVTEGDTSRMFHVPALKSNEDSVFVLSMEEGLPVPLRFAKACLSFDGTELELSFDSDLDSTTIKASDFYVYSMDNNPLTGAKIKADDPSTIMLSLSSPMVYRQKGIVIYNWGSLMSADSGMLERFGPEFVDNPLPGFRKAVSDYEGIIVEVTFSKEMEQDIPVESFKVEVNNIENIITDATLKEGDSTTIVFALKDTLKVGDLAFVSYTPGTYKSGDGYALGAFGPKLVENASTVISDIDNFDNEPEKLEIYPNPVTDILRFNSATCIRQVLIYNSIGQQVYSFDATGRHSFEISTAQLEKGVYIIRSVDVDGKTYMRKAIKY
jgi:GH35 family endo-1,4-beta-xylanase